MFEKTDSLEQKVTTQKAPDWSSVFDDMLNMAKDNQAAQETARLAGTAADLIQRDGALGEAAFNAIAQDVRRQIGASPKLLGGHRSNLVDAINNELQRRGANCSLEVESRYQNWCKPYPPPADVLDHSLVLRHSGPNAQANKFWPIRTISMPRGGGQAEITDYGYNRR
jgi:hypothetical protein